MRRRRGGGWMLVALAAGLAGEVHAQETDRQVECHERDRRAARTQGPVTRSVDPSAPDTGQLPTGTLAPAQIPLGTGAGAGVSFDDEWMRCGPPTVGSKGRNSER